MMKFIKNHIPKIAIFLMLLVLIPCLVTRISNEEANSNVTLSLLYNDIRNDMSAPKVDEMLDKYKGIGVDTVAVMEEDINSLSLRGLVAPYQYNVLCYQYDADSMAITQAIKENCPKIENSNKVFVIKEDWVKKLFKDSFPKKFTDDQYTAIENVNGMDVYVVYDATKQLWDFALGYNENEIKMLKDKGFNISLIFKIKNYAKTDYLADIDRIVKKYDIEFFNIKENSGESGLEEINAENYNGISKIINDNDMTLVVTENTDQLSNQKPLGYSEIFSQVMTGSKKVVRSYESYDDTHYKQRTEQLFNSTVDRNIRFITVTQVHPENYTNADCADYTFEALSEYVAKIKAQGFTVNGESPKFDYTARKRNYSACAVIMIMALVIIAEILRGKKDIKLTVIALILSAAAALVTVKMPQALLALYPTVYCVILSSFAMTILLYFIKKKKDSLNLFPLTILSVFIILSTLLIGAIGMGTMLSGINYYVNNDIFRGIKLSLIVPALYSAIVFYFMFIKQDNKTLLDDIKNVLNAEIKVFWLIIAAVIGYIGMYYITRSGNVSEISSFEQAFRNTITEIFPARPRTKEFLIGYPSLILLVYYVKNTNVKLLQWVFAVGTSILAASVTNSYCHVFTDYSFITMRVLNGLLIGIILCIVVYLVNMLLVKLFNRFLKDKI